jgi:hypothetical protein
MWGVGRHSQKPDKVECTGNPDYASPVRILATDDDDPYKRDPRVYHDGEVTLGATFDIDARRARDDFKPDDLESNTWVHIFALNGRLLQSVGFHTSCSQPLVAGDQFGSLVLEGFVPKP